MELWNKVTAKVYSILKSLDIPFFRYNDELIELQDNISELGGSLKYNRLKVSDFNDNLSRCKFKLDKRRLNWEIGIRIEKIYLGTSY